MAQGHRGARRRCGAFTHDGVVPRGPLCRHRARCVGGAASPVGDAVAPAAPMGGLLAGRAVVAGVAAGSILGRSPSPEPQGHAMGSDPAGVGRIPADRTGQRVEAASRLVRQERHGRPAGSRLRAGRGAQALRLPRPSAAAQGRVVLASHGAVARPVQCELRCAALRSDQYRISRSTPRTWRRATSGATATAGTSGRTARRW